MELRYLAGDGVERVITDRETLDRLLAERELSRFSIVSDVESGRSMKVQEYLESLEPGKGKSKSGKHQASLADTMFDQETLRNRRNQRIRNRTMKILRLTVIFFVLIGLAGGIFFYGMTHLIPPASELVVPRTGQEQEHAVKRHRQHPVTQTNPHTNNTQHL